MIANINVSLNTNQVKVISEYHFAAKMFTVMETVLSDFFDKDERIWNIPSSISILLHCEQCLPPKQF